MCFACDKWDQTYDNIYAVAKTIEALRGIERWGTGDMVEQAFTGFVALPSPKDPHAILGVRPGASEEEIDAASREHAKRLHPDVLGGDVARMAELNEARQKLKERAA
jgi:DnaJ-domain-containing protein 1